MNLLEEIKRLRELAKRATPGPWRPGRADMLSYTMNGNAFKNVYTPVDADSIQCSTDAPLDDAHFIATSRTAIPTLCDALEKAIDTTKRMLRAMEKYEMDVDDLPPHSHVKLMDETRALLKEWGIK